MRKNISSMYSLINRHKRNAILRHSIVQLIRVMVMIAAIAVIIYTLSKKDKSRGEFNL